MHQPREKILIVDDERFNISALGELLHDEYEVIVAKNGAQAMNRLFGGRPPDLILLDILMPDMSGYELCSKIKDDPLTKDIPVIFISAMDGEADEARGFEMGGVDYITKPFRPVVVKARIRTHLELKKHREQLEYLSNNDGLTGIPNRRRLDEYMQQQWASSIHMQNPMSVIMADIDYFKPYNDNYGHVEGDVCLKRVAKAIASVSMRRLDLIARYGGEEFVAILPQTDAGGAKTLAGLMIDTVMALKIPHAWSEVSDQVTVSIGIASINAGEDYSIEEILKRADQSLYRAKEGGRNRVDLSFLNIDPKKKSSNRIIT